MYQGVKAQLLDGLRHGLQEHGDITEIIFTGHSLGAALAYLLVLDIIADRALFDGTLPRLKIAAFGPPRPGDKRLSEYWHEESTSYRKRHGAESLVEYSVKAYNDGAC